jgi:hypothetical protein
MGVPTAIERSEIHRNVLVVSVGYGFRLRSLSYGGQVAQATLRADRCLVLGSADMSKTCRHFRQ